MFSKEDFKNCLALFASGVTVVTYQSDGEAGGVTVSSFSSLSLEPPLVLFCLDKKIYSHSVIQKIDQFAIHILREDQEKISSSFASSKINKHEFLQQIGYDLLHNVPTLKEYLALLVCKKETLYEGGDHSIVVSRVLETRVGNGNPLLYFNRGYRKLQ